MYFVPLSNWSEGVASAFFFSRVRWDRGRVGSNISVVVSGSFGGTDFSKWDVSVSILCSALWFLVSTLPGEIASEIGVVSMRSFGVKRQKSD